MLAKDSGCIRSASMERGPAGCRACSSDIRAWPAATLLSSTAISTPRSASLWAMARPMWPAPPVMAATRQGMAKMTPCGSSRILCASLVGLGEQPLGQVHVVVAVDIQRALGRDDDMAHAPLHQAGAGLYVRRVADIHTGRHLVHLGHILPARGGRAGDGDLDEPLRVDGHHVQVRVAPGRADAKQYVAG